jgi:hypothetical protein
MQNESNLLLVQITVCIESCLPRILAHFYLMKKSAKVLLYFGLDCGMFEFFTHKPRTIDVSPAFWSMARRKRSQFEHMQTVIQTSKRLDSFLHEEAQNFELLSNIQDQK